MDLAEAIKLIECDELKEPDAKTWADLGCGSGLFTKALSKLLPADSKLYAIDKNASSFKPISLENGIHIHLLQFDFVTEDPGIGKLNGILMANSLHFVSDKRKFIRKIKDWFDQEPLLVIVEYDSDSPNPWVPFPISYKKLEQLFFQEAFTRIKKINTMKSRYQSGTMYSALIQ